MCNIEGREFEVLSVETPNSFDLNIIISLSKNFSPEEIITNLSAEQKELVILGVEYMRDSNEPVNMSLYLVYEALTIAQNSVL